MTAEATTTTTNNTTTSSAVALNSSSTTTTTTAAAAAAAASVDGTQPQTPPIVIYASSATFPKDLAARLHATYGARVVGPFPDMAAAALADPLGFARAVRCVINLGQMPANFRAALPLLPNLALVCSFGSGYNEMVPFLNDFFDRRIYAAHSPNANSACVADQCLALILSCTRRIVQGDLFVRSGAWAGGQHPVLFRTHGMPRGLGDLRLGILGLGAIGRLVARRAAAFDMAIGYCNRKPSPDADPSYQYFPTVHALATWCDVLAICLRADGSNRHIVDASVLAALGPGGFVVNISRGTAIDEAALAAALADHRLAGCGLDVFEDEPRVHPDLLRLGADPSGGPPFVVLTPHAGGWTTTAYREMSDAVLRNFVAVVVEGGPPVFPIPEMADVRWPAPAAGAESQSSSL